MPPPQVALDQSNSPNEPRSLPPVKPPRVIVEHFDLSSYKIDQAHGYVEADCQHCRATIKGQKNVTSNFIQHMRRKHPDAYDSYSKNSTHRGKKPRLSTPSLPLARNQPSRQTNPSTANATASADNIATVAQPASVSVPLPAPATTPSIQLSGSSQTQLPLRKAASEANEHVGHVMLLETALVSATYRGAVRTRCDLAAGLSTRTGCQIHVKREDLQVSGFLIFRAAYNYLAATPTARGGVLAAGKCATSVAAAAHKFSKPCSVVLREGGGGGVLKTLAGYEAKVEFGGGSESECVAVGARRAREMNRTFVDLAGGKLTPGKGDAVAGYATLALELLQQCPHADRVFMEGGNALLFSGVAAVLQRLGRGVKLIGVVLDARCDEGEVEGKKRGGEEDDIVVNRDIGEDWMTFTDEVVKVGRSEMCAAVKAVFEDCDGCLLEPMGALAVAAAVKYIKARKLTHERVVCVVDSPLRKFESLEMVSRESWRADGSKCLLCVQKINEGGGTGTGLVTLMQELSGMAGGRVRVSSLRFGGKWPLLLGLECDELTTAGMHVANLTSLGYTAIDVTRNDFSQDEMWMWEKEREYEGEDETKWGVFRVELPRNSNGILRFLGTDRADLTLNKVSFSEDGGGTARLLVAAKGTEWQLTTLEREMGHTDVFVRRLVRDVNGLRILGCGAAAGRVLINGEVTTETCDAAVENGEAIANTEHIHGEGGHEGDGELTISFTVVDGQDGMEVDAGGDRTGVEESHAETGVEQGVETHVVDVDGEGENEGHEVNHGDGSGESEVVETGGEHHHVAENDHEAADVQIVDSHEVDGDEIQIVEHSVEQEQQVVDGQEDTDVHGDVHVHGDEHGDEHGDGDGAGQEGAHLTEGLGEGDDGMEIVEDGDGVGNGDEVIGSVSGVELSGMGAEAGVEGRR